MVRCPFCHLESPPGGFKQVREPWRFGFYTVRELECLRCKGVFNHYEGVSPRSKYSAFTTRVRPR